MGLIISLPFQGRLDTNTNGPQLAYKNLYMNAANKPNEVYKPNHSHAWRGTWNRPMLIDEDSLDPLTVARMTNHNVKGLDQKVKDPDQKETASYRKENAATTFPKADERRPEDDISPED